MEILDYLSPLGRGVVYTGFVLLSIGVLGTLLNIFTRASLFGYLLMIFGFGLGLVLTVPPLMGASVSYNMTDPETRRLLKETKELLDRIDKENYERPLFKKNSGS